MICCGAIKQSDMNKQPLENSNTLTGQIVKKTHVNKACKTFYYYDLYLRCSVQDYFIKFCESSVTKAQIEALNLGEFGNISIEGEIKEGDLDICPNDSTDVQSRIGHYVVIYKILS